VTRYGYARVSAREQNPDSQWDALTAAGIDPPDIVIEKITGKLASRPKLDTLLARLQPGDQVVVTRLRRIGRNHQHLLDLSAWFEAHQVDFIVLEQGIDTTTPIGRLFFRFSPRWPSSTAKPSSRAPWKGSLRPGPAAAPAAARPSSPRCSSSRRIGCMTTACTPSSRSLPSSVSGGPPCTGTCPAARASGC
jgi:hypothetical protein